MGLQVYAVELKNVPLTQPVQLTFEPERKQVEQFAGHALQVQFVSTKAVGGQIGATHLLCLSMPCPMQAVHLTDSSVLVHAAHPVGQDFDLLLESSSELTRGKSKFRQRRGRKKRIDLMFRGDMIFVFFFLLFEFKTNDSSYLRKKMN